jgi:5-methylthioadenosine/S-adenosylhomocysteine deaminase
MTLLRGLADDLRLDVWLMGYMMPVEREFVSPELRDARHTLGCAEMIRSGVTVLRRQYYFEEAIAARRRRRRLRACCGQTVLRFPAPDAKSYEDSLGSRARVHPEMARPSPDRARRRRRTRPYTAPDILRRVRGAGGRIRRAPHYPPVGNRARGRELSPRPRHAVVPWVKKQRLFDAKVLARTLRPRRRRRDSAR